MKLSKVVETLYNMIWLANDTDTFDSVVDSGAIGAVQVTAWTGFFLNIDGKAYKITVEEV